MEVESPPQRAPVLWQWGKFQGPHLLPKALCSTTSLPLAEIGVGITGFGIFFILFGTLLYFDSVLLAFGNVSPPALYPHSPAPTFLKSLLPG